MQVKASQVEHSEQLPDGIDALVPNLLYEKHVVALHDLNGDKPAGATDRTQYKLSYVKLC